MNRIHPTPHPAPPSGAVIGLLGGMSWPSTITYYRGLNAGAAARLGGSHSARVVIWSDDYAEVERMQLAGDWDAAAHWIADGALRLRAAGADVLGIACNTMHRVADAAREASGLPLVDIVDTAADAARDRRISRAAVLGTRFTAATGMYTRSLTARGIEPVLPSPSDQELLDRLIYGELCLGTIGERSREEMAGLVERLTDGAGADGIVLACTELNLLMDADAPGGPPVVDTARAHVDALLAASLS